MYQKVNLKSIANDLGLSVGTVSRILNGKAKQYRISQQTVELVSEYALRAKYSPNLIAKSLQSSQTYLVGLMIPDIANPFFAQMAKNIEQVAFRENYSIILVDAADDIEIEKQQIENLLNRRVDGIIAAPIGTEFSHFMEIQRRKIPLIFIDRYDKKEHIPFITSDNYQGGYDATKYLIENGHRRIALIKGDHAMMPIQERRRGYQNALQSQGISIDPQLEIGNELSIENGYRSTLELLSLLHRPSAIFALNNLIGLGVLQAFQSLNLTIPDDLSLIVFDDQPYASYLNPPLTTVKQDTEQIGQLAIAFIIQSLKENQAPFTSQVIPTRILFRKSVKNIL